MYQVKLSEVSERHVIAQTLFPGHSFLAELIGYHERIIVKIFYL